MFLPFGSNDKLAFFLLKGEVNNFFPLFKEAKKKEKKKNKLSSRDFLARVKGFWGKVGPEEKKKKTGIYVKKCLEEN
jgi:hypothetical protein